MKREETTAFKFKTLSAYKPYSRMLLAIDLWSQIIELSLSPCHSRVRVSNSK